MVINRKFGDYFLLERLAVGGQSEVFLAMKQGPCGYSRPVVIKALPSDRRDDERYVDLFYREAFISSRFNHPNVINVHDARRIEGEHCMFMDFVSGQTVADIAQRGFRRGSPPTLKQVVQVVADGLEGLHYVHTFRDLDNQSYSVVHRDVSPQNLMVTYYGTTMLFDFGIARIIGLESADEAVSGGKYAYMSPEQVRGEPVGPASDIFSMGVILYELSTGFRLFRRDTQQEVIDAVTSGDVQPPRDLKPEIPHFVENCIMKALQPNPLDRYKSAQAMQADLKQYLDMTAGGELRRGIGAYVSALFKAERTEIASVLRAVPATDTEEAEEEVKALPQSDDFSGEEATMELGKRSEILASLEAERVSSEASEKQPEQESAPEGDERGLEGTVARLRSQQTVLYILLAIVSAVAIALMVSYLNTQGEEKPRESTVIEIE